MSFLDWLSRSYRPEVIDTMLGRSVKVTAKIPPKASKGSYANHKGIDVKIDPPVGKDISHIAAEEWIEDQLNYYDSEVVEGNLKTSSGATRGNFEMGNITVREDGFSFRFQEGNHPAGMPYAQLATFIEVSKGKPIIAVDTAHLEAVIKKELEVAK